MIAMGAHVDQTDPIAEATSRGAQLSQFFLGANVGAVYFGDADESVDALIGRASDAVNEAALSGAHHRISEAADRPPARIAPKYNLPRSVAH